MTEFFNKSSQKNRRKLLRRNMPISEIRLWLELRGKRLDGYKFRRQYGIGPYIVDFYCPSKKLVIEIDGDSHFHTDAIVYDTSRQIFIEDLGISVIRFTNHDVRDHLEQVLEEIKRRLVNTKPPLTPPS